jgi:hypothetical protein
MTQVLDGSALGLCQVTAWGVSSHIFPFVLLKTSGVSHSNYSTVKIVSNIHFLSSLPLGFSTDCGSETTHMRLLMPLVFFITSASDRRLADSFFIFGVGRCSILTSILRYLLPAHRYVRSMHDIGIERSRLRLRLEFGNNAVLALNFRRMSDSDVQSMQSLHLYCVQDAVQE